MCIFECWQTPKPLQNEKPTVSAIYKMLPLQNQEPVIAYPCRHIGCQKKGFWQTPRGPDNGEESFVGIEKVYHFKSKPSRQRCILSHSTTWPATLSVARSIGHKLGTKHTNLHQLWPKMKSDKLTQERFSGSESGLVDPLSNPLSNLAVDKLPRTLAVPKPIS